jgi:hypothetical protein
MKPLKMELTEGSETSANINQTPGNNPKVDILETDYFMMVITEYFRYVDRAILNTVFENTVRRVNKCLETGGGHFQHYL